MKKKIILHGIGNFRKHNHYIFEKTQKSFEAIAKLFSEELKLSWETYDDTYDEDTGKCKNKKILVKKLLDIHMGRMGENNSRLDVFYGKEKIFVTLVCSLKQREKINKKIEKITKMPKVKKHKPKKRK